MEFTYEGFVRYAFGFYNPNHAAAFICALLPFFWTLALSRARVNKVVGFAFSLILLSALFLTYSRAGLLVLLLEAVAFVFYYGGKYWKAYFSFGVLFIILTFALGVYGRLTFDASAANRFEIWLAGLSLFVANPLGLGFGNSGEIVSAFLLPDGVSCRTLINSHLTLLCEFGILVGLLWFTMIFYAVLNGFSERASSSKFAALISFCGLLISSSLSTIFDFEVLIYPSKFGYLSALNYLCQCLNFFIFAAIFVYLLCGKINFKRAAFALSFSFATFLLIFICGNIRKSDFRILQIDGETFVGNSIYSSPSVVLFDDDYSLKSAVKILRRHALDKNILISKNSWQSKESLPKTKSKKFILFGACADFADAENLTECVLIAPPPHFNSVGKKVSEIYIPKLDSRYRKLLEAFSNAKNL